MTASVDRFVKALLMECEDTASTDYVNALIAAAKAQITGGNGTVGSLNSASINGKSFTQMQSLTADEVLYACRTALRLYAESCGSSPITFPDLSNLFT